MSKKLILIIIPTVLLIAAVAYFLIKSSYNHLGLQNKPDTTKEVTVKNQQSPLNYPELPAISNSQWVVEGYAKNGEDGLIFSNEVVIISYSPYTDSYIKLNGPLHYTKISDIPSEQIARNYVDDFYNYYTANLNSEVWKTKIPIDSDHDVLGMAADGIGGSLTGYVALEGDNLKSIILWHSIGPFSFTENSIPSLNCPCTVEFKVFESEPMGISDLLNKL